MKIALGQVNVVPNSPEKNLESMLRMIGEAKEQHADLIAFPEMVVGGYLVGDKWLEDSFCEDLMHFNDILLRASDGIAIAYGNIFLDREINERVHDSKFHPNKDGRTRRYNAVYIFQNGKPVPRAKETNILPLGVQPKTLLPNYRFFDDERYFFSLQDIAKDFGVSLEDLTQPFLIEVNGGMIPIGFELCEDLWCGDYRRNSESLNPTKMLIGNGARYIINISSSPWTFRKNAARDRSVQFLKQDSGDSAVPFFYINHIGAQNNGKDIITFDGGSTVYNADGLPIIFSSRPYQEELTVVGEDDLTRKSQQRVEKPKIAQKYEAIIEGIKHIKVMMGLEDDPNFAIGLSGGIDSAVTAALVSIAVGPEKLFAINMPTEYNSELTKNIAERVARNLDINYGVIPIGDLSEKTREILEQYGPKLTDIQYGNVMAKHRGTTALSNYAAMINGIFTNNGNKLEVALGYATLYGDIGGAIAPIADLTKTEVVEMAEYLNHKIFGKEVIPAELIPDKLFRFKGSQVQPSAELETNQVDPMKFGYHCALIEAMTDYKKKTPEDIMQWYLDGTMEKNLGISTELMERWNVDKPKEFVKDLEWFAKSVNNAVYKRVQTPPIIILSKSAYGYDIRESQLPWRNTAMYEALKKQVLEMDNYTPKVGRGVLK